MLAPSLGFPCHLQSLHHLRPVLPGLPLLALVGGPWSLLSRRMAGFRWYPVTWVESSRIRPPSFRSLASYRPLTASVYSPTLPRLIFITGLHLFRGNDNLLADINYEAIKLIERHMIE